MQILRKLTIKTCGDFTAAKNKKTIAAQHANKDADVEDGATSDLLKIDGEVGNKKQYDPRSYGKSAEKGMADRVKLACEDLRSVGTKMK